MSKKTNIQANERIDLTDFNKVAYEYTDDSANLRSEKIVLDKKSRILDGFRIRLDSPAGQITVFNGNALDRSGQFLNDESAPEESITTTLSGATTNFYLEVEFTSSVSDSDSRMFWDPTFDNGGAPTPDGKEFPLTVPTRQTNTWRLVLPVSTTAFARDADPDSTRIPLVKLSTNGSNVIDVASNPGLSTEKPASVLTADIAIGAGSITVKDARLLAAVGSDIIIAAGGASPETVTVSSVDRENGIVVFAPITASAHTVGAIVQDSAAGTFIVEKTDPSDTSAHPDYQERLFQGNEKSAIALTQSKSTFGDRNDLNVRSDKDFKDMVSGLIEEMKFGNMDPAVTSTAPPSTFATRPRYFDNAGSIAGARTATISIGNGTTSFGDFNGTDETPFTAALAALPAAGGTIFIKEGTYTFANAVQPTKAIKIIGESPDRTIIVNNSPSFAISATDMSLSSIKLTIGTGSSTLLTAIAGSVLNLSDVTIVGMVYIDTSTITASKCTFAPTTSVNCLQMVNTVFSNGSFTDCTFSTTSATNCIAGDVSGVFTNCNFKTGSHAIAIDSVSVGDCILNGCTITPSLSAISVSGTLTCTLNNCKVSTSSLTSAASSVLGVGSTAGNGTFTANDCAFTSSFTGTGIGTEGKFFSLESTSATASALVVNNCSFGSTSASEYSAAIKSSASQSWKVVSTGCTTTGLTSFLTTSAMGTSGIDISSLVFDGSSLGLEQRIIDIAGASSGAIAIRDSSVVKNSLSGVGTKYFCLVTTSAGDIDLTVDGCEFTPTSSTADQYLVYKNNAGTLTVRNCIIELSGVDTTVIRDSASTHVEYTNNLVRKVLSTGVMIVLNCFNSTGELLVTGNKFVGCLTTAAAGTPSYIVKSSVKSTVVSDNAVSVHTDSGTAGSSTIYVGMSTGSDCSISNNTINQVSSLLALGVQYGIYVQHDAGSTVTNGCSVVGNSVIIGSAYHYGIRVFSGLPTNIIVANNTVSEDTKSTTGIGLAVEAQTITYNAAVTGNSVYGKQSGTARVSPGIYLSKLTDLAVTGNSVYWDAVTTSFTGISCDNINGAAFTSNSIQHGTLAALIIAGAGTTSDTFVITGNSTNGGSYTPGSTAFAYKFGTNV